MNYEAVIGLEVHAQVHTQTKMFCGCRVQEDTGDLEPNTYVCPVCLALPGALPVVNRSAVERGMLTGLALNCTINPVHVFARKSYFYPDLPKGYQISQYELPLATDGHLDIEVNGETRRIGVTRAHLEEDTAKLYRLEGGGARVDFNRAGVPLIEIVSEPDMRSVDEVRAYATLLHDILVYVGVNAGDMEKGEMRFEANVSVRLAGSTELGTRVEIKNLNSFRALTESTAYEIERQIALVRTGGQVEQQTLGWDEVRGETYPQRSKEHAHDYRYFPEPDIPPLDTDPAWLAEVRTRLPELPQAKRRRFMADYGVRAQEANLLVAEKAVAEYFDQAVQAGHAHGIDPQDVANWITGELFRILNDTGLGITDVKTSPDQLIDLLRLLDQKSLSATAAKTVLNESVATGEEPAKAMARLGLQQISDADALTQLVDDVLAANPDQVARYREGKTTLIGWFIGQVMQKSKGRANPQEVRGLLEDRLK